MNTYTEEYDLTKTILSHLIKNVYKGTTKWENDNTLIFMNKKIQEGKITLNDKEITIEGDKIDALFLQFKKIYTDAEKNSLKTEDVTNTPLSEILDTPSLYGNLHKNKKAFLGLIKTLEDFKIKKVLVERTLTSNTSISDSLSLFLGCSSESPNLSLETGWNSRLQTFLFDEYSHNKKKKEDVQINNGLKLFKPFVKENIIDIIDNGMIIGKYYSERNFIFLFFNPLKLREISILDENVGPNFDRLIKVFKELNIETKDVSAIQEKIFVTEFLKNSVSRVENIESEIKETQRRIADQESTLQSYFSTYTTLLDEKTFVKSFLDSKGIGMYDEVKKIKNLPFVTDMTIEGSQIIIKYKPTFIPIPDFARNDGGKTFGKRYVWVGGITFTITPGHFSVSGDVDIYGNHCHPHASGMTNSSACFGDGEGRLKIFSLLSSNKFVDLAKMLWFWINTYKNSGAYVKMWSAYDTLLLNGYPVLDAKGNRIELNDPERIKTGEQTKLTKGSNYDSNIKRFKDLKLEV